MLDKLPDELINEILNFLPTRSLQLIAIAGRPNTLLYSRARANFDKRQIANWYKPINAKLVEPASEIDLLNAKFLPGGYLSYINEGELKIAELKIAKPLDEFRIIQELKRDHHKLIDFQFCSEKSMLTLWQNTTSNSFVTAIYLINQGANGPEFTEQKETVAIRLHDKNSRLIPALVFPDGSLITAGYIEGGKHKSSNCLYMCKQGERKVFDNLTNEPPITMLKALVGENGSLYFLSAHSDGSVKIWKKNPDTEPLLFHNLKTNSRKVSAVTCLNGYFLISYKSEGLTDTDGLLLVFNKHYICDPETGKQVHLKWKISEICNAVAVGTKLYVILENKIGVYFFKKLNLGEEFNTNPSAVEKSHCCNIL